MLLPPLHACVRARPLNQPHARTCRPASAAASCTTRLRPPLCVIAPLQLHVMSTPPGRTTPSASALRARYLLVARTRDALGDGKRDDSSSAVLHSASVAV